MNTLTDRIIPCFKESFATDGGFQIPRFHVSEQLETLEIEVFIPGVSPDAVSLAMDDRELVVKGARGHRVRSNWQAANLEAVQSDYQLRIALDESVETESIWAVHRDDILRIHLQKNLPLFPVECSVA